MQIIADYLTDISTRKDANLNEVPAYSNSTLINHLGDSLNASADNHCVLITAVSGSFDHLTASVDCLQVQLALF